MPNYYRTNVVGGPGAFVIVAENFNSFGQAIVKKLIAEIAGTPPATGRQTPRRTTEPADRGPSPIGGAAACPRWAHGEPARDCDAPGRLIAA